MRLVILAQPHARDAQLTDIYLLAKSQFLRADRQLTCDQIPSRPLFSRIGREGCWGSFAIQDCRQKLDTYCSRWEIFYRAERTLLGRPPIPKVLEAYVDKGFLVHDEDAGGGKENIYFVRLPSAAMALPQKEWMVRGLPATCGHRRAIHPPSNLLATPVLSDEKR